MGAATLSPLPARRDTLSGTLFLSIFFHGLIVIMGVAYANLGFHIRDHSGQDWGAGGAIRARAVSSLPGVPLPTPMVATLNNVATQNPGLYKAEPEPPPPVEPKAAEIPKFMQEVKPDKAVRINKRIPKTEIPPPSNAVPFGSGGQPAMSTGQFSNSAGEGELNVATGGFGERYGWYVSAVRNRISTNWLLSTISPNIMNAPRVYLTFSIRRDGTIEDVQITQSSGVPEVDRSAMRAVLASNPLGPLPPDFPGNSVAVNFYFDFRRR